MGRILHRHMPHLSSRVKWESDIFLDEKQKRNRNERNHSFQGFAAVAKHSAIVNEKSAKAPLAQ